MTSIQHTIADFEKLLSYDPQTGVFTWAVPPSAKFRAGSIAGAKHSAGYWQISFDGRLYLAHRIAWLLTHGCWPTGQIDHINGCRADNRIANLRDVTQSVNMQNQRRAQSINKSSKLLGASWSDHTNKWKASIRINGKQTYIGYFETQEAAHEAYLLAKRKHHAGCTI